MGTATAMSARSLQYYVIANRWASDLEFFRIEMNFLHSLMDDYFIRLCEPPYLERFNKVNTNLLKLDADKNQAEKLLTDQLKHIELMSEDIIPEDIDALSDKQIQIEYLITDLTNEYREAKKVLFNLIETIRRIKAD